MKKITGLIGASALALSVAGVANAGELTIATVNNGHMIEMQNLLAILKKPTLISKSNG